MVSILVVFERSPTISYPALPFLKTLFPAERQYLLSLPFAYDSIAFVTFSQPIVDTSLVNLA